MSDRKLSVVMSRSSRRHVLSQFVCFSLLCSQAVRIQRPRFRLKTLIRAVTQDMQPVSSLQTRATEPSFYTILNS